MARIIAYRWAWLIAGLLLCTSLTQAATRQWRGVCDDPIQQRFVDRYPLACDAQAFNRLWKAVRQDLPPLIDFEKYFVIAMTGQMPGPCMITTTLDHAGNLSIQRDGAFERGNKFEYLFVLHEREGVKTIDGREPGPPTPSIIPYAASGHYWRARLGEQFVIDLPHGGPGDATRVWKLVEPNDSPVFQITECQTLMPDIKTKIAHPTERFCVSTKQVGSTRLVFQRPRTEGLGRYEINLQVLDADQCLMGQPITVRLKTPGNHWRVDVEKVFRHPDTGDLWIISQLREEPGEKLGGWTYTQQTIHIAPPNGKIVHWVIGKNWPKLQTPGIHYVGDTRRLDEMTAKMQPVRFVLLDGANQPAQRIRMIGFLPDRDINEIASAVQRDKTIADKRIDYVKVLDSLTVQVVMIKDPGIDPLRMLKTVNGHWRQPTEEELAEREERDRVPNR